MKRWLLFVLIAIAAAAWPAYVYFFLHEPGEANVDPETLFYVEATTLTPFEANKAADELAATLIGTGLNALPIVLVGPGESLRYGVVAPRISSEPPQSLKQLKQEQWPAHRALVAGIMASGGLAWNTAVPYARYSFERNRKAKGYPLAPLAIYDDGEVLLFYQTVGNAL